ADDQLAQGEQLLLAPGPVNARALLPAGQPTAPGEFPGGADPDDEPPAVLGYRLASGGIGVGGPGRDARLDRPGAVKVLRHALRGPPRRGSARHEALAGGHGPRGIRDKAALEKLPPDEQKAFTQIWADVAALRKKDEEMPN